MAKQLVFEGFIVRPVAFELDLEEGEISPIALGEQKLRKNELETFAKDQWPTLWASLQEQHTDLVAQREADAKKAAKGKRSAKATLAEPPSV